MLLICRTRRNGRVDMLIALAEENIERIKQYDQAEVIWSQLPSEYANRMPASIGISFCSSQEQAEIERLSARDPDWKEKAFKLLTRGFEFKPELGDHDFGPTVLGEPTKGPKQ